MIRKTFLTAATLAAVVLTGTIANAADRHVVIRNATNSTMWSFYASNTRSNSWEEDILHRRVVPPGGAININIDDGTGACLYDFKAVFANGVAAERRSVDVCSTGSYTYY